MTHDVHDIERELEDTFAARAAGATVSDNAAGRIDARVTQLRHRSYMRGATSIAAIVAIIGASAVVATSGHGKKQKVSVAEAGLPSFSAPEFTISDAHVQRPMGTVPTTTSRAYCMKIESVDGKPKCTQPYSLVGSSDPKFAVVTELGAPPFFIDRDTVSIRDFYPPTGRAVKVRGHDAILTESTAALPRREPPPEAHQITSVTWTERPGLLVRVNGVNRTEKEVLAAAETLVERTTRVPVTYVTNTFASSQSNVDVISNGIPVKADKTMAGLWSANNGLCFGVLDVQQDLCRTFDRNTQLAVSDATKYDPFPVVMGTVRSDAVEVMVTFSNGYAPVSKVGGAALGLGVGFWAVEGAKGIEPKNAVALDAHGAVIATIDLQHGLPALPPAFRTLQTGSTGGHAWRVAEATVNGTQCAEIAYLGDARYFCNVDLTPMAVGAVDNFTLARLAPNATHARIEPSGFAPADTTVTVVHAAGMNIAIGPRVDGTVVATGDDGHEIARLPTVLANNGAITSATLLGSGSTANGAWQSVITPPPLLMDTADHAAAGAHDDGTLCTGASYGTAHALTCVSHNIYDGFIGGNEAAAATLKEPPVMVGIAHADVPEVEVQFVDGSTQRAATTAAPGVPGVRVWSIGMPAAIKQLVSLDASGHEIATSTNFIDASGWPGG